MPGAQNPSERLYRQTELRILPTPSASNIEASPMPRFRPTCWDSFYTQLTVKQMLKQKSGNVASITAALADQPIAGDNASVSMMTKGGLKYADLEPRSRVCEGTYPFQCCGPWCLVFAPLHKNDPKDPSKTRQPNGENRRGKRYCRCCSLPGEGRSITGEVLHVDGGAHAGCW